MYFLSNLCTFCITSCIQGRIFEEMLKYTVKCEKQVRLIGLIPFQTIFTCRQICVFCVILLTQKLRLLNFLSNSMYDCKHSKQFMGLLHLWWYFQNEAKPTTYVFIETKCIGADALERLPKTVFTGLAVSSSWDCLWFIFSSWDCLQFQFSSWAETEQAWNIAPFRFVWPKKS